MRLDDVEKEIDRLVTVNNVGALSLNTQNLKLQLRNECRSWKMQYASKVHAQVCAS
jgi:dynein heavy chain, axonemal